MGYPTAITYKVKPHPQCSGHVLVEQHVRKGRLISAEVRAKRKPRMRTLNGETVYYSGKWLGCSFTSLWHWARSVFHDPNG